VPEGDTIHRTAATLRTILGHPSRARVVIETLGWVAVCFDAPVIELLDERSVARHPQLTALGPDLAVAEPEIDAALARMDQLDPQTPVGVALLDQRVASGVGNVYRSEVLWAAGADPFRPIDRIDPELRRDLLVTASRMLRANLDGWRRRTVPGGLAVYDRAGRPCRRCGATIRTRRLGEQARSVWWCPGCQS
jgi:endonuclease-8